MIKHIRTLFFSAIALAAPLLPVVAQNDTNIIDAGSTSKSTGLGTATPIEVTGAIISGVLGLLGIIALVLIIYSGFTWMTAGGNEDKVGEAKQTLQAATIGLLVILSAYGIALFVFSALEKATGYQ